ncbi:MAG: choline-sulfatase, partial [Paracoccaceae bacterium]
PSRAAFMTGRQSTQTRAYDNSADFPTSLPTFAHALRAAGYATCLTGKMHFTGPDQLHGFEERLTTDVYPSDFAWTPDWSDPLTRIDKWYHNMDSVQTAGPAATTFQIEFDEEATFLARRRIMEHAMTATQPGARPLAMVVGLMHPHDPYVPRPEFWDMYPDEVIDMPATPAATDPHSLRLRAGSEGDAVTASDAEIRSARRGYYANSSYFDAKVGQIVQALDEAQMLDNTIVIVTSDHGDMLGERDLWYKMSWFDHSGRVPMVVAGPGVRHATHDAPCSLVDLAPTLIEIAGTTPRVPLDGISLWPTLSTGAPSQTEAIGEYCAECAPGYPVCMIRRGQWKYIHCAADPAQLYDMQADPLELTNLADDPAHADVAAAFAAEAAQRWDDAAIRAQVIDSQQRRYLVNDAMQQGTLTHWDHTPPRDASNEYVRNHMDWTVAAARTRFPPAPGLKERS